jgi:uroporphyrinogen decarboxylase
MDKSFNCDWMHINNTVYPEPIFHQVMDGDEWEIVEDNIGNRLKRKKRDATIPQFEKFAVSGMEDYEKLTLLLDPMVPERYAGDFDHDLMGRTLRGEIRGVNFHGLFGFGRDLMGLEGFCYAIYDDIGLIDKIFDNRVKMAEILYRRVFEKKGLDFVQIWEDMAYKTGPMVSPEFMKEHFVARYKRITEAFRAGGVSLIMMDCDGNIEKILPLLRESGIDGIYPCEIAAGSDPLLLRRMFPEVSLAGGIDKRVLGVEGREGVKKELRRLQPLIREGGYIPYIDHFIPPDISYDTFCYYMDLKREVLASPEMKI